MNLVVAGSVNSRIEQIKRDLPAGLLLVGEPGVGLATIGRYIAGENLEVELMPILAKDETPSLNGTISIEAIRKLYQQTRGIAKQRQVVLIDDADRMSPGASNALLKLLEEPPENTHFILTTHHKDLILPTVISRLQTLSVPRISAEQTQKILDLEVNEVKRRQLNFMAAGRPAELRRLIDDAEYFAKQSALFGDARQFLAGNKYQKVLIINRQSNQQAALSFCDSVLVIARTLVSSQGDQAVIDQIEKILTARERIAMNGNIKLNLIRAMV